MVPSALEPGHVLGGRFAIIGLLGSGGTASVYLVIDQLHGERVALKVVHPHLAADPNIQRRIRREIAAASVLDSSNVLVPDSLHDLDGFLCLSLPYHTGQTLAEYVAATGPLPVSKIRELGIRIGGALEQAHRHGLLHRDVTANNVMVDHGDGALLMDFGLARAESASTRSTGMLGTTGFAAPEVYAGERADPRTDLYGLGCLLYLATTGRLPFNSDNAMGTLQMQLAESHVSLRELRPDCPDDLAITIESLLRRSREERPSSAGEVVAALSSHTAAENLPVDPTSRLAHLPPGDHRVIVSERDEDRSRRKVVRVDQGKARRTFESEVSKRAQQLWTGVLAYVGVHEPEADTPEQLLLRAITDEATLPHGVLRQPPAVLQKRFVLVEGVSRDAAKRIAADAKSAGFRAQAAPITGHEGALHPFTRNALLLCAILGIPLLALIPVVGALVLFLGLLIALPAEVFLRLHHASQAELPVAYTAQLDPWLSRGIPGRHPVDSPQQLAQSEAPAPSAPMAGITLLDRAQSNLDALASTLVTLDLPAIVQADLRDTLRDLRERADELSDVLERLEQELAKPVEDASWVEPRLARLRTKQRAGERIDTEEILRLQGMLRAHEGVMALQGQLESQVTTATAGLLEIAATATSVRRELLAEPNTQMGATGALSKLKREAQAASAARRELRRRT